MCAIIQFVLLWKAHTCGTEGEVGGHGGVSECWIRPVLNSRPLSQTETTSNMRGPMTTLGTINHLEIKKLCTID